jgi:hypothetical protein
MRNQKSESNITHPPTPQFNIDPSATQLQTEQNSPPNHKAFPTLSPSTLHYPIQKPAILTSTKTPLSIRLTLPQNAPHLHPLLLHPLRPSIPIQILRHHHTLKRQAFSAWSTRRITVKKRRRSEDIILFRIYVYISKPFSGGG